MEEDPLDQKSIHNNQNFLSISPMIRETLEKRRVQEIKAGNHQSMIMLNQMMIDPRNSQMVLSYVDDPNNPVRPHLLSQRIEQNYKQSHLLPSFAAVQQRELNNQQTMVTDLNASPQNHDNSNSITMDILQSGNSDHDGR